jgi:hypothetical protein
LWLVSVPGDEQLDAWAGVFPNLIDRVFGRKVLTWKFFMRSCLASILAVTMSVAAEVLLDGRQWLIDEVGISDYFAINFLMFLSFALVFNCVPDYLSVLISRYIVRAIARRPTASRISYFLILDTISTLLLANLSLAALAPIVGAASGYVVGDKTLHAAWFDLPRDYRYTIKELPHLMLFNPLNRAFVIASLFTSIWVWLYVFASVAIRILHKVRFVWDNLLKILDIEKKPLQAIGRAAGVMAGCGYLAAVGGVWLFEHL